MTDGKQQGGGMTAEQRAQIDATLLGQFNDSVRQSQEMLTKNGAAADRARDISFARSLLFLPQWHVVACIVVEDGQPQPKRLAMIEVRDAQGQPCPSLAVFATATGKADPRILPGVAGSTLPPTAIEAGKFNPVPLPVAGD